MKEHPILFSAPMVRAILAGTKTQTRRVVKEWSPSIIGNKPVPDDVAYLPDFTCYRATCPYGQPGDRLWVRETFFCNDAFYPDGVDVNCRWREVDGKRVAIPLEEQRAEMLEEMHYRADGEPDLYGAEGPTPWRPSIHMPRWASRITLEITGVRVERLQAISEADALAEGVKPKWEPGCSGRLMEAIGGFSFRPAASAFADLWESINGPGSWDANPWVRVVEFQRVEPAA